MINNKEKEYNIPIHDDDDEDWYDEYLDEYYDDEDFEDCWDDDWSIEDDYPAEWDDDDDEQEFSPCSLVNPSPDSKPGDDCLGCRNMCQNGTRAIDEHYGWQEEI